MQLVKVLKMGGTITLHKPYDSFSTSEANMLSYILDKRFGNDNLVWLTITGKPQARIIEHSFQDVDFVVPNIIQIESASYEVQISNMLVYLILTQLKNKPVHAIKLLRDVNREQLTLLHSKHCVSMIMNTISLYEIEDRPSEFIKIVL